jgi:hypothetical protein
MVQARALLVTIALTVTVPSALAASEKQIRRDCTADALQHCAAAIPMGRKAIIACMVENRDKLQPKCSQHIY